jgi:hypothetical protein
MTTATETRGEIVSAANQVARGGRNAAQIGRETVWTKRQIILYYHLLKWWLTTQSIANLSQP